MGLRPVAAAVLLVLAVAACGSVANGAERTSTTSTSPPNGTITLERGGVVTVAVPSLPTEFNPSTPAGSNAVTQMVMEQVWPQPFIVASGNRIETGPGLITAAELVGVKPETVEYTLANGARWSDGVPISVADFVYNWHESIAEGPLLPASFPLAGYESIASIRATKDDTVTVVFKTPYADWQGLFANLVPAHIAERYGWTSAFAGPDPAHLVSGGPFTVSRVTPGVELVLSRNPSYWGRPARLSEIVFKVESSAATTLADLVAGRVDVAELDPSPAVTSTVLGSGNLNAFAELSPVLWQLDFNLADPVVSSLDVRLALANLINRAQLVSDSAGLANGDEFASSNHLYGSGAPGHRRDDGPYEGSDLAIADQLLQSAGYSLNGDGLVATPSGTTLSLTLTGVTGDPLITRVEDELQAQLLVAGIQLHIHNVALSTLLDEVLPLGEYELTLAPYLLSRFPSTNEGLYTDPVGPTPSLAFGTTGSPAQATATKSLYGSGSGIEPAASSAGVVTRDVLGFDDPVVSTLFARAVSQLNFLTASNLYNRIDTQLWNDMVGLPLFQAPTVLVSRDNLVNVSYSATWAGPMWNAEQWGIQLGPPPTTTTTTVPAR
ncbi:MAG: ABC transporter substrate-binding protein [Acidimicrobiales bacterium]